MIPGRGLYLSNFMELADQLWSRNWDTKKRNKEYKKMEKEWKANEGEPLSVQSAYFEGHDKGNWTPFYSTVPLTKMTDRQEAVLLMRYADALYATAPAPGEALRQQKAEIDARLNKWT